MSFTITAPPNTDIWRAPPSTSRANAPTARTARGRLRSFRRAALTAALPPLARLNLYDQAGLLLAVTRPGAPAEPADDEEARWLKAGVEVMEGAAWVSTVVCERWCDASLLPLGSVGGVGGEEEDGELGVRIEVERAAGEGKSALWVYLVVGGKRVPVRAVTWWFEGEEDEAGWEISVGAFAARPGVKEGEEGEGLRAEFEGLEIEWA